MIPTDKYQRRRTCLSIPSDYVRGHSRARPLSPRIADNYVEHTLVGDPNADDLLEQLAPLGHGERDRLIHSAMTARDLSDLTDAPACLVEFFREATRPPDWVQIEDLEPASLLFQKNSRLILGAFVGGALVEGFSTNISRSFNVTGRLRHAGVRRLKQNIRHLLAIFEPQGLAPGNNGWKLSLRIRLVHAQVRRLLKGSPDWDEQAWGVPLSAAHLGLAVTAFSARMLIHLRSLGGSYDDRERRSFMDVWRYAGYLMGIPETILYKEEADALQLFGIGRICEPTPEWDSVITANALVNSAPMVIGVTDPVERRKLAKHVYSVSRAMIGKQLADELRYPASLTFGVLYWFRLQGRYVRLADRFFPRRAQPTGTATTANLANLSLPEEGDKGYALPRHPHSERSGTW